MKMSWLQMKQLTPNLMTDSVLTHQGYPVKFSALKFTIASSVSLMLHKEMLYHYRLLQLFFSSVAIPEMTHHHHHHHHYPTTSTTLLC